MILIEARAYSIVLGRAGLIGDIQCNEDTELEKGLGCPNQDLFG
jgi:hypothetical protein